MTTQARELAKIVTNAGDLSLTDDVTLASDASVLNFGADSDVTLTHVADTGLLLNSTRQLQFGDSGTYIHQSADGVLDLVSDTEIELNATTLDINANVDISGTLTVAGALDFGDAALSNVGDVQLDSIAGDGDTNTSITFPGSDVMVFDTGGTERLRINASGSVILNHANPTSSSTLILDKDGNGSAALRFYNAASNRAALTLNSDENLVLEATNDIIIDSGGQNVYFEDDGTRFMSISQVSSDVYLGSEVSDKDMFFRVNDGGSTITALTLDGSDAGKATFNGAVAVGGNLEVSGADVTITANLIHAGDTNTYFGFNAADTWRVVTGGTEAIRVDSSQRLGIGTDSPGQRLQVQDTTASDNKSIAHFHGTASAGSATDDGGQFITVTRNSPISQANGVMGGIAFCGSNPNNAGQARIQGNYKYTGGRDMEFLISVDNDTAPRKVLRLDGGTGQAEFIGGATTGLQETYYNNSYMTLADDATFDIAGVANVGALIVCQAYKKGGSITYPAAIFFMDQLASAGIVKVADPQGAWSLSDSDGSWNIFHNGNTNVRIKNRNGVSNRLAITVFKFLGV